MRVNRSAPPCTIVPVLTYPDPWKAAEWLVAAFGFSVRLRIANHRVQMKFGEGCLTIAGSDAAPSPAQSVQVRVENVDEHCARARHHGALILSEPTDYPYGERQYSARDFHGHLWNFTQTVADVEPESWGGVSVEL